MLNLASQLHCTTILEACCPQHFPHIDLYATAFAFGIPYFPLVLGALLRLVEHPPNMTAKAAVLTRDV